MDTMVRDVKKQTMSSSNSELHQEMAKQQQLIVKHSNLSEHKITKKHLANVNEQSEEIAQRQRGLVKKKECQEASKDHHKMISKENVGISQDYIAKNEEKLTVCRSPSTNNKDMLKREKGEQQQVWKSEKQKVVEIKENKGMAVHLEEIEKVRCLASQNEVTKEQKPVENGHLHPSNVSGEQIGKHKSNMTKEKGGWLPLSDLFK